MPAADVVAGRELVPFWSSEAERQRIGHLSLAEYLRHNARFGPGGRIVEEDGVLLFSGSHPGPNPYRNGAIRLDGRLPAGEVLARASAFFAARKRPYVVWARDEPEDEDLAGAARAAGMQLVEADGLPQMALERWQPGEPLPEGVELRRPDDEDTARDYVLLVAEAWGMEGISFEVASALFFHPASLDAPNVAAFVAYVDGRPASGGMAVVSNRVALACQGATAPWARRRGLGEACVRLAVEDALDRLGAVGAVTQTSPMGANVWARIGFRQYSRYLRFLARPQQVRTWE